MDRVKLMSCYDESHMQYVWYIVVRGVITQVFDSPWDAIVAGIGLLKEDRDRLDYIWDAAICLSARYGDPPIIMYRKLLVLIGEK